MKFDEIFEVNGNKLNKKYLASLNKEQREQLIEPIFDICRANGFLYPDNINKVDKEWERLLNYQPNISLSEIYNNSSLGTYICKYFCRSFYLATEKNKPTMLEIFNDDIKLRKLIYNRLGLEWWSEGNLKQGNSETFNLSMRMMTQGLRSSRAVNLTSIFKPDVAKLLTMKYSNEGDLVHDSSCGYGGRMLGAISTNNRKYIGTDPLTIPEIQKIANHLKFSEKVTLIQDGSENFRGKESSVDFSMTSPPYLLDNGKVQEYYSSDITQAYAQGVDYFYNVYWQKTLENVKFMLKPNKLFALNILASMTKMYKQAVEVFGEPIEIFQLRNVRSHLNKSGKEDAQKYEPIYIFKKE